MTMEGFWGYILTNDKHEVLCSPDGGALIFPDPDTAQVALIGHSDKFSGICVPFPMSVAEAESLGVIVTESSGED